MSTNHRGVVKSDSGVEDHQADVLLATGTQLVTVTSDGAVLLERADRQAIGSGTPEALGFLGDTGPWTVRDVVEAVRRASLSDLGVAGPIWAVDTVALAIEEVA
jgi:ATP-dependent protease HslVU (ClpYQ) peptidase subunit